MAALLSPALLQQMVNDPKFTSEFKFLVNPPKKPQQGCGGCGGNLIELDWHRLKRSIMGMPDSRQRRMKELLGVAALKVWYRDTGGKMKHVLI